MATLRELATQLIDGNSIVNASRVYVLHAVMKLPDGAFKATLTSDGMRYSHAEPARSEIDAVYMALISLQMMGRFMSYASDDIIAKQNIPTKSPKPKANATQREQKPKPVKVANAPVVESDEPNEPLGNSTQLDNSSPAAIERSIILRIVSKKK